MIEVIEEQDRVQRIGVVTQVVKKSVDAAVEDAAQIAERQKLGVEDVPPILPDECTQIIPFFFGRKGLHRRNLQALTMLDPEGEERPSDNLQQIDELFIDSFALPAGRGGDHAFDDRLIPRLKMAVKAGDTPARRPMQLFHLAGSLQQLQGLAEQTELRQCDRQGTDDAFREADTHDLSRLTAVGQRREQERLLTEEFEKLRQPVAQLGCVPLESGLFQANQRPLPGWTLRCLVAGRRGG